MTATLLTTPDNVVLLVCATGCGTPLHPAAAAGGFDRHPGCEPAQAATYAWICFWCKTGGPADSAAHGIGLNRIHTAYACPGAAGSPTHPEHGFLARVARHNNLARLYPGVVPAWTRGYRAPSDTTTTSGRTR